MLTDLQRELRLLTQPGDAIVCAVSGGADSMALLWGLYLLRDRLDITLSAAHFNHGLRGTESDDDAAFVERFCAQHDIPLSLGFRKVTPGKKGLEAAARDARYAFLNTLPGKIATAHTADDNTETVLMHLVRGTGLRGLGGIAPVNGRLIRPMLGITRVQVEAFLDEWSIPHREDSSNETEDFLRNRLRHYVMPLLKGENPRLSENVSAMARRLRLDEDALARAADAKPLPDVEALKAIHPAIRARMLERYLRDCGVCEPEARHIAQAEALLYSPRPSARGEFPGGVVIGRRYGKLTQLFPAQPPAPVLLPREGTLALPEWGISVTVMPADTIVNADSVFTLCPEGPITLRSRREGDILRRSGGSKALKKLFIDRKIPAHLRPRVPVLADSRGVLAAQYIGASLDRVANSLPATKIVIQAL